MKIKHGVVFSLKLLSMLSFFCKVEGSDLTEEIRPEIFNALLTRMVDREKLVQEDIKSHPDVSRVIILGNTGSGKSTLVHALAGRLMIVREDADGELFIDVNKKHMIENSS